MFNICTIFLHAWIMDKNGLLIHENYLRRKHSAGNSARKGVYSTFFLRKFFSFFSGKFPAETEFPVDTPYPQ